MNNENLILSTGGSAADAKSVMNEEYNYYLTVWKDLMTAAGVSN